MCPQPRCIACTPTGRTPDTAVDDWFQLSLTASYAMTAHGMR